MSLDKAEVKAEKNIKEIVRKKLKRMILESELTQRALCQILGIPYGTLRNYLNGSSEPTATHINILCTFFKITADELLGRGNYQIQDEIGEIGLQFCHEIENVHPLIAELSLKLFRHSLVILKDDARLSENATRLGPNEKKLAIRYFVMRKVEED